MANYENLEKTYWKSFFFRKVKFREIDFEKADLANTSADQFSPGDNFGRLWRKIGFGKKISEKNGFGKTDFGKKINFGRTDV